VRFYVNDAVVLRRGLPDEDLVAGAIGAVVLVFDEPEPAYEVEFCDDVGRTIAQVVLGESDLGLVHRPTTS
jgi:hypothetical protein